MNWGHSNYSQDDVRDPRVWTGRDGKRNPQGENHRNSKLTEDAVREIKTLRAAGRLGRGRSGPRSGDGSGSDGRPMTIAFIAARYGVSPRAVRGVLDGETWTHVKPRPVPGEFGLGSGSTDSDLGEEL